MTRVADPLPSRPHHDGCPGSVALHAAQDGWLARVRVPGGRLPPRALDALARAAALGNGLVDLTSRANLQVRGLAAGAAAELVTLLGEGGLLPSVAHDRVRNLLASPVAGRHPRALAAVDPVVAAIDRGLCGDLGLAGLPGRFLFAVDDGSGLALDHLADVTLIARAGDAYALALGGQPTAARVAAGDAAPVALAAAGAFLAERALGPERAWRIRELARGPAAVAERLGIALDGCLDAGRPAPLTPGRLDQRDGRRAITALVPLGRLEHAQLAALAGLGREVRLGTAGTVTVVDVAPATAGALERRLAGLGLVLERGSGWLGLSACPGLGRCPKARVDVRAAAAARAVVRGADARPEHWAACERRCGERRGQPVAVAARADGLAVRRESVLELLNDVPAALAVLG